jgi:hypothetical protein
MKSALTTLALSALALCGGAAHAQTTRAALVQDVERPTAANIVTAHCVLSYVTACPLYTVPTGKILHVTQLGYAVVGYDGISILQISTSYNGNWPSLWYSLPNKGAYNFGASQVDLYMPAGAQITAITQAATVIDVSLYGVLSDQ